MEAMNTWLYCPISDNLNQDFAIRQYCPARMEQEQGGEWRETTQDDDIEMWAHFSYTPLPDQLASPDPEVDEFVDSFFNVESYERDNNFRVEEEYQPFRDHFQEGVQDFAMMVDDLYIDVPMMIEGDELEASSSSDELFFNTGNMPKPQVDFGVNVDQGLQLVHLLLACAEAMGCRDTQLADSILSQIWPCVSPWGDSLQRVSYCFAMGLKSRLSLIHNVNPNGSFNCGGLEMQMTSREAKFEAFHLLNQVTPYIAFGFMAANDAICQASMGKDSLHIIDLGMEHTLQWPSLIRSLASRSGGAPRLVQLTGIIGDRDELEIDESMKGIIEEAKSLGIDLRFHLINESITPALLTREKLNVSGEEGLLVNSVLHLHKHVKESRGSLKTILQAIKKLNPLLLTVVEQDANHNGPFFLGRFLESLHYYSAIFDSLESCLPRDSPQRTKVEKFHFAEEIRNVIACEGSDRIERHERADQWRRQIGRAGFQVVGMKCMSQAKMMVSVYGCDGYTIACEKGCLLLGWKGRPIMLASAWQVHNVASS